MNPLSPLNTGPICEKYLMHDLVYACNNYTKFELNQNNQIRPIEKIQLSFNIHFDCCDQEGRQAKVDQNWYESIKLNGGYHHAKLQRSLVNSLPQKKPIYKCFFKARCTLCH